MKQEAAFENTTGSEHKNKFFDLNYRMKHERTHNMGLAIAGGRSLFEVQSSDARHRQAPGRCGQRPVTIQNQIANKCDRRIC